MLRSLKEMFDFTVEAVDGPVGVVNDFYFDDYNWAIRYAVIGDGPWRTGMSVLLSPLVLEAPDPAQGVLPIKITRELVESGPKIDSVLPVSRQQEIDLHNYYHWPFYWVGPGEMSYPLIELETEVREKLGEEPYGPAEPPNQREDPHLRSAREVIGYEIGARDGTIGYVSDFIVDDSEWKVQYMIVNAGELMKDRFVLLSPQWIEQINWEDRKVEMDLGKDTIRHSPEYDPNVPLTQEYETRLYDHYQRKQ